MASLAICLERAKGRLAPEDAAMVERVAAEYRADGVGSHEAALRAVDELLDSVREDRAALLGEIRAQGGAVPMPAPASAPQASLVAETTTMAPGPQAQETAPQGDDLALLGQALVSVTNDPTVGDLYEASPLLGALQPLVAAIERVFAVRIVPVRPTRDPGDKHFEGFTAASNPGVLYVNTESRVGFTAVVGHELLHHIRRTSPELYAAFIQDARQHFRNFPAFYEQLRALQTEGEVPYTRAEAVEELAGNFVGDAFLDADYLRGLAKRDGNLFQELVHRALLWLQDLKARLTQAGYGSSDYFRDVEGLRASLSDMLQAYVEGGAQAVEGAGANFSRRPHPRIEPGAPEITDPAAQERISTRRPTSPRAPEKETERLLTSSYRAFRRVGPLMAKAAELIRGYPQVRVGQATKAETIVEKAIEQFKSNLVWLWNKVPPAVRERAKLWYVGARGISDRMSERYAVTPRQFAGVVAANSPQKDWYMNVSLAERITAIWRNHQGYTWDGPMDKAMESVLKEDAVAEIAEQAGDVDLSQSAREMMNALVARRLKQNPRGLTREQITAEIQATFDKKLKEVRRKANAVRGKKLSQLWDDESRAIWIRVFDTAHHSPHYQIVSPEGNFVGTMVDQKGNPKRVGWGSFKTIQKSVSILRDGSLENISDQLGNAHKIRNFYNNIVDPNDAVSITTDTHAIAAGMLSPFSGNSDPVRENFGIKGNVKSAVYGLSGTYPIHLESYLNAADEIGGVIGREVQSVDWEAVRGLFPASIKKGGAATKAVEAIWNRYKAGDISQAQAQQEILDYVIKRTGLTEQQLFTPDWFNRPYAPQAESSFQPLRPIPPSRREVLTGIDAEVAPNPDLLRASDDETNQMWNGLTYAERMKVTQNVARPVLKAVMDVLKIKEYTIDYTAGGFEGGINPSVSLLFGPNVPYAKVREAATIIGHLWRQKAMIAFNEADKTTQDGQTQFVKIVPDRPLSYTEQGDLYNAIGERFPPAAGGFASHDGAMVFGNFDGMPDADFLAGIKDAFRDAGTDYSGAVRSGRFLSNYLVMGDLVNDLQETSYGRVEGGTSPTRRDILRRWRGDFGAVQTQSDRLFRREVRRANDRLQGRQAPGPGDQGLLGSAQDPVRPDGGPGASGGAFSRVPNRNTGGVDRGVRAPGEGGLPRADGLTGNTLPVRSDGRVPLTHWGRVGGLQALDPAFFGTAAAGAEKGRLGPDFRKRTYYALPGYRLDGAEAPVASRANARYFTSIDPAEIYDIAGDPDGLRAKLLEAERQRPLYQKFPGLQPVVTPTDYENAIIDAGYRGYWTTEPLRAVALFDEQEVVEVTDRALEDPAMAGWDSRGSSVDTGKEPDIKFSRTAPAAAPTFEAPDEMGRWDKVKSALVDSYQAMVNVQEAIGPVPEEQDVSLHLTTYPGRLRARVDEYLEQDVKPLLEAVKASGRSWSEIGKFLHARHAQSANAVLKDRNPDRQDNEALSGMSDAEAQQILAAHANDQLLQLIGQYVDRLNERRLQILVDSGVMPQAQADAWAQMWEHYVPLNREELDDALPSRGQGFDARGKIAKTRAGSTRAVDHKHLVARVLAMHEAALARAEKNEVAKALYQLAEANPNSDLWEVGTENLPQVATLAPDQTVNWISNSWAAETLVAKIDGENKYVTFNRQNEHAQRILKALKDTDGKSNNIVFNSLLVLNRALSMINTGLNPEFVISNFFRDIQTAAYNLTDTELKDLKTRVIKDVPKAMGGMRAFLRRTGGGGQWATYAEEFAKAGGMTGWMSSYEGVAGKLKQMQRFITSEHTPGLKQLKRTFEFIDDYNGVVENGVRLSAYVNARSAGLSQAKAARLAKELTVNFNRRGEWGLVMNALYLFYNASIQGTARMLRAVMNPKNHKLHAALTATVAFATLMDMLNREFGDDDDDRESLYDKVPDYVKERNLVIMDFFDLLPEGSQEKYFTLPLPWGYNWFFILGQEIGKAASHYGMGKVPDYAPTDSAGRLLSSAINAFSPVNAGTFLQTLSPTFADPFVMIGENKDWTGRPLMPNYNPSQPNFEKFYSTARAQSQWLAAALHEATLNPQTLKASLDFSPEWIDVFYDFATGGAGRFLADTQSLFTKAIKGEPTEMKEVPLLRKLVGSVSDSYQASIYYDRLYEILDMNTRLNKAKGTPEWGEMRRGVGDRIKLVPLAKAAKKQVTDLKKRIKLAEAEGDPLKAERFRARMVEVQERFSRQYLDVLYPANGRGN